MQLPVYAIALFAIIIGFSAHAKQIMFMSGTDQIWNYPKNDGSAPVKEKPANDNWVSPVNYRDGRAYMKYEALDKPSDYPFGIQLCFWMPNWSPETCSDQGKYSKPGTYYFDLGQPGKWWHKGTYPWDKNKYYKARIFQKDGNKSSIMMASSKCGSYCFKGDVNQHIPVKYNVQVVFVAKGDKLVAPDGWKCPESWGCSGGGAVGTVRDAKSALAKDAQHFPRLGSLKDVERLFNATDGRRISLYTTDGKFIASQNNPDEFRAWALKRGTNALLIIRIASAGNNTVQSALLINR